MLVSFIPHNVPHKIHFGHYTLHIKVNKLNCSIRMVFYRVFPKTLFPGYTKRFFYLYYEFRFFQPLLSCHCPSSVADFLQTDPTSFLFVYLINLSFCRVLLRLFFFTDSTHLTTSACLNASSNNLSVLLRYHAKLFFLLLTVF